MQEHTRYHFQSSQQPYRGVFPILILQQGFSAVTHMAFGAGGPLWWGLPVHCRVFTAIPGLHPLDASSTLPRLCRPELSPDSAIP